MVFVLVKLNPELTLTAFFSFKHLKVRINANKSHSNSHHHHQPTAISRKMGQNLCVQGLKC